MCSTLGGPKRGAAWTTLFFWIQPLAGTGPLT